MQPQNNLDWQLTHGIPQYNVTRGVCNCGTIEYVWTETAGTTGVGSADGVQYFTPGGTKTQNYMLIGASSGGATGLQATWSIRAQWTNCPSQGSQTITGVTFQYAYAPACSLTSYDFTNLKVSQQSSVFAETVTWPLTGSTTCPGVNWSLTLEASVSGDYWTDLSYFQLTLPTGKVRVTANPTSATIPGHYQLKVSALLSSNLVIRVEELVTFTVIGALTLNPATSSVIIGDSIPTVKTFGPTDTIQNPAGQLTIQYQVENSQALPSFISVSYGTNSESVTISIVVLNRAFKSTHPSTVVSITATPVEMPALKKTTTYTIQLIDPCDSTTLTGPTLSAMTTTALRIAPETQQITQAQITDTVSYQYGSGTGIDFCYQRSFSISSTPPSGKTQLTASMLTIDSTGLISVNTHLIIDHGCLGVHTVTVRSSFSTSIHVDTSFQLTINKCVVTSLTLNTPYVADQVYTIGDLSKEWTYTQQFAKMEPLCPYTLSFSFSNNLPDFIVQTAGITTKLTARSMYRSDASIQVIQVVATVAEQPTSQVSDQFQLQVVDPCLSTQLSDATIPELVAFQGYSASTSFKMQITDSKSNQIAQVNPGVEQFCGPIDFTYYCNSTVVTHLSGQNFEQVVLSPTSETKAGFAECHILATLPEVQKISKVYKFNATTLGYTVTPIKDRVYYVGSTQLIPFTKFKIYPSGYVYDLSNYTLHMTEWPSDLQTPLDLTLLRDLDTDFFTFDPQRELITIFNEDQSLPQTFFHLVLTNIIDEVILWTQFTIEMKLFTFQEQQNTAPKFTSQLTPIHLVEQCEKRTTINWSYKLPGLEDREGDQIMAPQVQFTSEAISYNKMTREFKQEQFVDKPINLTVSVLLEDTKLATKTYEFQIQFLCLTNFSANFSSKPKNVGKPPTAFIQSIQPDGLMTIRFSQLMKVPDNAQELQNSTVFVNDTQYPALDIRVQPGAYSDPYLLEMNFSFVFFSPNQMKIQLDFENPLVVSSSIYSRDFIDMTIYGNSWFMDMQGNFLEQGFKLKSRVLPTMTSQQAVALSELIGSSVKTATGSALVSSSVINFLMSGPLKHILSLVHSTQIQLHLLLIDVPMPASASYFFAQLMSLVTFQLIDLTQYLAQFLQLEDVEPLSEQFRVMGYESLYVIINLGALFFVIFAPYLLWLFIFVVVGFCAPKYKKFKQKFTDTIFFNKTFVFFNETYLLFAMCASLNVHYLLWNTWGNVTNSFFAILLLVAVVLFPFIVHQVYTKKQNQKFIRDREQTGKQFMNKFGLIVQHLNVHRYGTKPISYLYLGMFRKLWLVFMLVFMQRYVFWSVIMVNFQALFMIGVVASVRPFTIKSENDIELFNEFVTLVINYHLMMFTDFVQDPYTREFIGNSLVCFTGGNLAINVILIFFRSLRQACYRVKLHLAKRKNIKKANKVKREKQMKLSIWQLEKMIDEDKKRKQKAQHSPADNLTIQQQVNQRNDKNLIAAKTKILRRGKKANINQSTRVNTLQPQVKGRNKSQQPISQQRLKNDPRNQLVSDIETGQNLQQWRLPPHWQALVDQNNFEEIDRITRGQQVPYQYTSIIESRRLKFQLMLDSKGFQMEAQGNQNSQMIQKPIKSQQPPIVRGSHSNHLRTQWSKTILKLQMPSNLLEQEEEDKLVPRLPRGPDQEEFDNFIKNYGKERDARLGQTGQAIKKPSSSDQRFN